MGTCLSRKVAQANGDTNWQVLLFSTDPYSTLLCDGYCSSDQWGMLSATCRAGMKLSRLRLLAMLSFEKDRRRAVACELHSMVEHFNRATEIFRQADGDGHWIVGFEFQSDIAAFRFCDDVIDLQRRRERGVL